MQNPMSKGGSVDSRFIGGQQRSYFQDLIILLLFSLFLLIPPVYFLTSHILKVVLYKLLGKARFFASCFFCSLNYGALIAPRFEKSSNAINSQLTFDNHKKILRSVEKLIERYWFQCQHDYKGVGICTVEFLFCFLKLWIGWNQYFVYWQ